MFEWDKSKDKENQAKHRIPFADTFGVFEDPNAVTIEHMARGQHSDHFRT
jgi:uncharacterized DUF497 family protein